MADNIPIRETDRTREFKVKYYATQFARGFLALAGDRPDFQRLAVTAGNFALAARLTNEEHVAFIEAVLNEANGANSPSSANGADK